MNADYLDAHHRHWEDAEQLFSAGRLANADHLYGIAAECGLKRLMHAFGMDFAPGGTPQDGKNWVHVMETKKKTNAWDRYESYRSKHHQGASYGLPATNPFLDWDVAQRYAHQRDFNETGVKPHRDGASMVSALIKKATVEGLL
ncbi:SAM-dependent methyltransferase [uncultured Thiodictyon sp.]|jgi:hypothetical protein|uniref:SAM-dependent methyltransferase n=1 Tax=uncultured Thiodictyon sp. TaxID=1846217 RepID=UPI0025E95051|nr:SAM-dependent methyltransferase [uncultured Thiodictyon sp.]